MLLNSNRNIMLSILELLTTSPKPADPPAAFEYSLITEYLKYSQISFMKFSLTLT